MSVLVARRAKTTTVFATDGDIAVYIWDATLSPRLTARLDLAASNVIRSAHGRLKMPGTRPGPGATLQQVMIRGRRDEASGEFRAPLPQPTF